MPAKKDIEGVLENRDWKQLNAWTNENKSLIRHLMSRIYVNDGIMFWRAVEALGIAAHNIDLEGKLHANDIVRRYFWMLNDESGGTAWNSSEAIGSIIAHCPKTCGHFNWMYSGLLEDDSLRDGVLWGLGQMAQNAPRLVDPLEERIRPYLEAENPLTRGLTALIYALMRPHADFPIYREDGPKWSVAEDLNSRLNDDKTPVKIYQNGQLTKYLIQDLWDAEIITFWVESVTIKGLEVEATVAFTSVGLCWLGLGPAEEEEQSLRSWALRWFPKCFLIRKRDQNSNAIRQLNEYLAGKRKTFTVPLHFMGTPFQLKVWDELRRIPYGETRSYGELAGRVGNLKAQRAVGMANNKNPIAILVPCHRVIGKDGSLTGYAGGLDLKRRLLELEGVLSV